MHAHPALETARWLWAAVALTAFRLPALARALPASQKRACKFLQHLGILRLPPDTVQRLLAGADRRRHHPPASAVTWCAQDAG